MCFAVLLYHCKWQRRVYGLCEAVCDRQEEGRQKLLIKCVYNVDDLNYLAESFVSRTLYKLETFLLSILIDTERKWYILNVD